MLPVLLAAAGGYLIGSIPTAFWLTKVWKGVDIREVGSGNPGATNVLRAAGPLPSLLVFLVDVGKGVVGVELGGTLGHGFLPTAIFGGLAAVAGHNWSFWLRFRGGKGVSTTLGVFLALSPVGALVALTVFVAVVAVTRYVSLGSLLGSLALPIYLFISSRSGYLLAVSILAVLFIFYRHRANITRVLRGTEHKLTLSAQGARSTPGSPPPSPGDPEEFRG